jgi:hypothetical protein
MSPSPARLAPSPPTNLSSWAPLWCQGRRVEPQVHGEHSDFCRNTFEAPHNIATQHATSYEPIVLHPAQESREVTPSSGEGASSDVTIDSGREGIKGSKKRCKKRLQGAKTTTDHDDGNDGEACGSSVRHTPTAAHSDKRHVRPPIDHIKSLLEEACPHHAYPV